MKNNWKNYLLAIICFIISTSEFVIVGVLDKIAASAHISISAAGQLVTVFAIAGAIGTPIVIMVIANMDKRKVLMLSLSFVVLGSIMILVSPNYALLLASRIVIAIGAGVFNVTCLTVVAKLAAPERQAGAIATLTIGFNAALIIGLPIGRVVTAVFDWKAIFWVTGILSFLSIIVVALAIPATNAETPVPLSKQLTHLKNPKTLLTLAITFFWITGYAVLYTYITPFLMAVSPMSDRMVSIVLFAFGIATLVGNKLGGFLCDRIGVSKSIIGSMVIHVIALVLLSIIPGSAIFTIPLLILWAIAAWTPGPIQQYNIISLAPEAAGILLSLNSSVLQLAFASGAGIGGIVVESSSMLALSWIGAAFLAITVFIATVSFRVRRSFNDNKFSDGVI